MLCATLPLLLHLGHPERCFEIMMTPHFSSPMAMFGFVYAWYLMAVLLLELWFDYRRDFVEWSKTESGLRGIIYRAFTLGSDRPFRAGAASGCADGADHFHRGNTLGLSPARIRWFYFRLDQGQSVVGQCADADHLYLSAVVSGMALCVFAYMFLCWARRITADMRCLDLMIQFPVLRPGPRLRPLKGWTGCTGSIRRRRGSTC
jgi:hypothetical protein